MGDVSGRGQAGDGAGAPLDCPWIVPAHSTSTLTAAPPLCPQGERCCRLVHTAAAAPAAHRARPGRDGRACGEGAGVRRQARPHGHGHQAPALLPQLSALRDLPRCAPSARPVHPTGPPTSTPPPSCQVLPSASQAAALDALAADRAHGAAELAATAVDALEAQV